MPGKSRTVKAATASLLLAGMLRSDGVNQNVAASPAIAQRPVAALRVDASVPKSSQPETDYPKFYERNGLDRNWAAVAGGVTLIVVAFGATALYALRRRPRDADQ